MPSTGAITLGTFVGFILGYSLFAVRARLALRAAITAVGAALGTVPLGFIKHYGMDPTFYPIGLVVGLLIVRLALARKEIIESHRATNRHGRLKTRFAWLDIVIIAIVCLIAFVGALLRNAPWDMGHARLLGSNQEVAESTPLPGGLRCSVRHTQR